MWNCLFLSAHLCIFKIKIYLLSLHIICFKQPIETLGIRFPAIGIGKDIDISIPSIIIFIFGVKSEFYIFSSNTLFSKFSTYRLEVCNFARKGMTKMSLRNSSKILKRAILQNPYEKPSVVESRTYCFETYSENNMWCSLFILELQSAQRRLVILPK